MDDAGIVKLFLHRDERAIALAQERYGARLLAIARNLLGDEGEAEECLNDALFEAWNRIPPHAPSDWLFAFLARIIRAKALNRVKARGAEKRGAELIALTDELADLLASAENTEGAVEAGELAESVSRYLRVVSEEKRRVFVRRYWYAEPVKQIAARYGLSESKVKSLLWRARQELAAHLKKEGLLP